ncbi:heparan-alpha-glucosaminide N-acetyltransferase domain-containing protein [Phragmitibacter flavus]|nr:heparan-alpha-glucosaminide N-acetyltransferase domain-containing protein [Phragmitibacter flavus]
MSAPALPSPPVTKREIWIDLLRGFAVLIMLETHCVNVFLDPSTVANPAWMGWLNFFNGLAAPTFLWIAGYLQGLGIRRAIATNRPLLTRQRLLRLLLICLLGIALQIPWSPWLAGDYGIASWTSLTAVNILQCLAMSLFVLLLLGAWMRTRYDLATALLAIAVILAATAANGWSTGLMPLDSWLNRNNGSIFPFFPWFAFCAVGSLMGRWELSWKTWMPLALLMIFGGTGIQHGPFDQTHPGFFFERLGYVLVFAIFIHATSKICRISWLQLIGRQSLFIYVLHLQILHSLPLPGGSPDKLWANQLSLKHTSLALVMLLLICLAFAWLNEQRQNRCRPANPMPAST